MNHADVVSGRFAAESLAHLCTSEAPTYPVMMEDQTSDSNQRSHSLSKAFRALVNIFNHSAHNTPPFASPSNQPPLKSALKHRTDLTAATTEELESRPDSALTSNSELSCEVGSEEAPEEECSLNTVLTNGTKREEESRSKQRPEMSPELMKRLRSNSLPANYGHNSATLAKKNACINSHNNNSKDLPHDNRKVVHFADTDGQNLIQMQLFDQQIENHHMSLGHSDSLACRNKILIPLFTQPITLPTFFDRVLLNKICLESALPDVDHLGVRGVVRVLNMAFQKAVYVRWSLDKWESMCDYRIAYMESSSNTGTDKFLFDICAPLKVGEMLEFAVRYECLGKMFWDNNHGFNYRFVCDTKQLAKDSKHESDRPKHKRIAFAEKTQAKSGVSEKIKDVAKYEKCADLDWLSLAVT